VRVKRWSRAAFSVATGPTSEEGILDRETLSMGDLALGNRSSSIFRRVFPVDFRWQCISRG
jgi:hypothetical protein